MKYSDKAKFSQKAQNAKDQINFIQVVKVPRAALDKYAALPWLECMAAAERGDDDCEVWVLNGIEPAPRDFAYMEDCKSKGLLKGRACLFSQGWDALSPALAVGSV